MVPTCYRFAAALLFFLYTFTSVHAAELTVNKIAAVVNGEMITLHELRMHTAAEMARRRMPPDDPRAGEVRQEILDSLINDILIRQEAKKYKVSVSEKEAQEETKKAIARTGMRQADFEAELKRQGLTLEMYTERLSNNMIRQRMSNYMIDRKIFVTPEEIEAHYHKNRDKFAGEKTANFSIIMLPEKLDAQGIYKQVKAGDLKFEDAARQYSAERSAEDGGRVTGVPFDRLPPEMQKLLSSLTDGGISPLLRTQGGFVVIRRDVLNDPKPLTLQEATPRIEEILLAPLREERFKDYTSQLRSRAVIDIRI